VSADTKIEKLEPHRAAKRAETANPADALATALAAPQMAPQDHVLLGAEASPQPCGAAPASDTAEAEAADDRQLDLLPRSA
jgi:hypothetical protein